MLLNHLQNNTRCHNLCQTGHLSLLILIFGKHDLSCVHIHHYPAPGRYIWRRIGQIEMIGHMFEKLRKAIIIIRIENIIFVHFHLSSLLQLGYILVRFSWFVYSLVDGLVLGTVTAGSLVDGW